MVSPHAYTRKGTFLVTLTVGDEFGLTDATTTPVQVRNRAPRIVSSDPDVVPVQLGPGLNRSFSVVASDPDGDPLTYLWRIDGVVAGGNASAFGFSRPAGTYAVNVTVSDGSLATWWEWTVTVTASGTGVEAALPWIAGAILGAVLVLLLIGAWWRRRKPDAAPRAPPESPPPPPPPSAPPPPPSTPPPSP
jgi:chitinase